MCGLEFSADLSTSLKGQWICIYFLHCEVHWTHSVMEYAIHDECMRARVRAQVCV